MTETIAVWFSCGAASAVAAKMTIEKYSKTHCVRVINNPVAEEHPDNRRFLGDVSEWIGAEIEIASNSNFPSCSAVDVWASRKYMAGIGGAPCTYELKKKARQEWEDTNKPDWHVLGFTADESARAKRFALTERENLIPILVDEGITKADCFKIIQGAKIKLPVIYSLGYPNANCIGCVKATSPTYWNHVRNVHPETFENRCKQSRELGARLVRVKNERIFLDELKPTDVGRPMKNMDFECGIFCEER
jgi:hypothetical protein